MFSLTWFFSLLCLAVSFYSLTPNPVIVSYNHLLPIPSFYSPVPRLLEILNSFPFYGSASVTFPKTVLLGCIMGLAKSVSKYLNLLSKRFVAPTVMKPYRFGSR